MTTDSATPRTRRKLGLWICTALVLGNMVGSGIFLLPASLARFGGISILGWVVTSAGAACLALVFARLGAMLPAAGGPYAYSRAGFGDFTGFLVGWGYWVALWTGNAAIAVAFVGSLAYFWPGLDQNPVWGAIVAIVAIWVVTGVNTIGVRTAGLVQLITTIIKALPLLAMATVGLLYLDRSHFIPFNATDQSAVSALAATAALTLWAFLGLESATIPADEVHDPTRTIPTATVLGTTIAALLYILGTAAVMGAIPPADLVHSTAPFADAAGFLWGAWAGRAVAAGTAIACLGALNGWMLLAGQIPLAVARDGLFPPVFRRVSTTSGAPTASLVICATLMTALVAMNYTRGLVGSFTFIILLATLATLVPYVLSTLALIILTLRSRTPPTHRLLVRVVSVAVLALAYSLWAIVGSGKETIAWGCVLFCAGVPVYLWIRRRKPH